MTSKVREIILGLAIAEGLINADDIWMDQWGEIGKNKLGDFCFVLNCLLFFCFYGWNIIPKWLIKVPGHISILFG